MNYTEAQLVSFGNYLLSDARIESLKNHPNPNIDSQFEDRIKKVSHADIMNWQEIYNKESTQIEEDSFDFSEDFVYTLSEKLQELLGDSYCVRLVSAQVSNHSESDLDVNKVYKITGFVSILKEGKVIYNYISDFRILDSLKNTDKQFAQIWIDILIRLFKDNIIKELYEKR